MTRVVVLGVGCRRCVDADAVLALAREILDGPPSVLATIDARAEEPGLIAAARALGAPLLTFSRDDLAPAAARCLTRSARVEARFGLPSIAEAAALTAAGPAARLVGPRRARDGVTCALASGEGA